MDFTAQTETISSHANLQIFFFLTNFSINTENKSPKVLLD